MPPIATDADTDLSPRQQEIVARVRAQGFIPLETLARAFDVSTQTVRRDIIRLDEAGLIKRFHGGAGPVETTTRLAYSQKRTTAPDGKKRLAAACAALIPHGSSVCLDVGTTVEAVARALLEHRRMHVITTSIGAAAILGGTEVGDVVVTGGLIRGVDGSLVGEAALATLKGLRMDTAVIACSGFDDLDGAVMDFDVLKVATKKAMIAQSRRTILVADASKFTRSALVRVTDFEAVSILVTDAPPPPALAARIAEAGCRVVVADE
ncbi:DeoR family transcriptional regulator [Azorhizobium oxalatiphilum]|uniref:DeoR family transcriptional regulator n=1 Tax=Azorhizobium oxalatiphilum TaxID=980631 RepID=A0A917C3X5_9HYPH|nr:DeoR/GlpR family DNA-binding transcription regulator [Azorhizobium oxalatiphilum]GGF70741.1 DeoR family transcriptional regulator [Azorhizobium oxalatiphilum]